ncbi:MAG: Maf family protein [Pseudomonadota bacterium]|nr:Maf family protein [Pseudomonadota bacterium]
MKRQSPITQDHPAAANASHDFIYLASQSPRRRQLLEQIGVRIELLLADASEDAEALEAERPGELPLTYVQRVTRAKLEAARQRLIRRGLPPAPILCSDTTVALGRRIFGKPLDAADAAATLRQLSGRTHRVITAVAVALGSAEALAVSTSRVSFTALDDATIERYVAGGEPFGKAGSYAIQGAAGAWVTRLDGSYTGIMGLPLHETAELLRAVGVRG